MALNKQGKSQDDRYHGCFIDPHHFQWQSQNLTTPENKRGRELINHVKLGIRGYRFVPDHELLNKKAAPFRYYVPVSYLRHSGSAPMSIEWKLGA